MINPLNHPHRSKSAETRAYNDGYAAGLAGRSVRYYSEPYIGLEIERRQAEAYVHGYADGCKTRELGSNLPPAADSIFKGFK
jgi:ribosome modulation factor